MHRLGNREWRSGLVGLTGAAMVAATLVVLAAPSGALVVPNVTTEAGFRSAWADPAVTEIDLGADIVLAGGGGCTGVAIRPVTATTAVVVNGNGHTVTQQCPGNHVLRQNGTGAVTLQSVTITGGNGPGGGGGVLSFGAVTVTDSTISGNTATNPGGNGGGVFANTGVTVLNSTISGNTADGDGGGMIAGGAVAATNSTIGGNIANGAGGGINTTGAVTVTDSTISGNGANANSGGVFTQGPVKLMYATVVQNISPSDANLRSFSTLTSFASVVALPGGGGTNCSLLATTSNGFNFSDDANATTSCRFNATTDRVGSGSDPKLGGLANNGGSTQTRLPLSGSPLIDAIPVASCQSGGGAGATDQRNLARPSGPGCDIGAVEVQVNPPSSPTPATPAAPAPIIGTPKFTG